MFGFDFLAAGSGPQNRRTGADPRNAGRERTQNRRTGADPRTAWLGADPRTALPSVFVIFFFFVVFGVALKEIAPRGVDYYLLYSSFRFVLWF